jgi:hypothetical protein
MRNAQNPYPMSKAAQERLFGLPNYEDRRRAKENPTWEVFPVLGCGDILPSLVARPACLSRSAESVRERHAPSRSHSQGRNRS